MSTERDYQKLYDRLLEEVGALHRANQHRIRSGLRALLAVTVGLMLLMFLADGNKVFTLMLWILSMFAVAAYLIAVEYMDYELQKKLRDIAQLQEDVFDGLIELPELPAEPSEEELWTAYEKLDYDKMGEEAYHKAQEELWDDFDARSRAYSDAVKALRGEGVDKTMTPALLGYSTKTVSKLLGGEEAANVVYSPANLYLALSMLTETVDGETRAQLLDLLQLVHHRRVRGRGIQPLRPVALVQQAVEQDGLSV